MTLIPTSDGDMDLYEAGDPSTATTAVVVIQEAFGVTTHIQKCADRLAEAGHFAVAPSLFHRTGSPAMAYDDFEKVMPHMQALTAEGVHADLDAVVAYLGEQGFDAANRGIVGFCMGGLVAFVAATTGQFGCAVTFYGGGVSTGRFGFPPLVELAGDVKTPWLGCYGDLDKGIPAEDVEALRAATSGLDVDTEVVRYADADHGFNCDDRPSVFSASAATDAWRRTLAWFDSHMPVRGPGPN
jgi:carboxymethylenebutenolidase